MQSVDILTVSAIVFAVGALCLIGWYLLWRPPLGRTTKLVLLVALGPLPIAAALTGNVANYQVTKERRFCGSCHTMDPYIRDAADTDSGTLASSHSRNRWFGHESCYVCHADYGMFGTVTTKLSGMRHVWTYYVGGWRGAPPTKRPELIRPYSDRACVQCHARERPDFRRRLEHAVHADALVRRDVGCVSAGCHGPAHVARPTARRVEGPR